MIFTFDEFLFGVLAFSLFYPLFLDIKNTVERWRTEDQRRQWEIDFANAEHPVGSERKAYGHLEEE